MSKPISQNSSIFIAGHKGLVGSALTRIFQDSGYSNLILRDRSDLDLRNARAVNEFFHEMKPKYVVLAAAKVGGIVANNTFPFDFLSENLAIQNSVLQASIDHGVERLLFLGSSCIYPKYAEQPISESSLLTGALEETNRPYAIAKIAGIEYCWSSNRQHGTSFLSVMPTNLYGSNDNFHAQNSHVIPGLIRRFVEAKESGADSVEIWGTGKPLREFLYSDGLAHACKLLLELPANSFDDLCASDRNDGLAPIINVGSGKEITIQDLASLISEIVGFKGAIKFDHSKPDGTPRKLMSSLKINQYGWNATTSLREGITQAVRFFEASKNA